MNSLMQCKVEIDAHQMREHWNVVLHSQLPKEVKAVLTIWSLECKDFLIVSKHKLIYVQMVECINGESTIGRHMLQ